MDKTSDQGSAGGRTASGFRTRRIIARIKRYFWATDRSRLETYLVAYENELRELIRMGGSPPTRNDARSMALRLVERAGCEIDKGSTYTGWSCYNAAKRIEVLGFDQEQMDRVRRALLAEAQEKVRPSWRWGAIIGFVDTEPPGDEQPAHTATRAGISVGIENEGLDPAAAMATAPVGGTITDSAPAGSRNIFLERFALRAAMEVRDEALQNYYWKCN